MSRTPSIRADWGRFSAFFQILTPVVREAGLYLKRDDLFAIDPSSEIRGGKLRQCLVLVDGRSPSRILSAGSIHSPQLAIVAYVAQLLGLPCVLFVGGTRETPSLKLARSFGAEIMRCPSGRHTVIYAAARNNAMKDDFIIPFGMRPPVASKKFYELCALQVRNIPTEIQTIVVACGSGVTTAIIAFGLWLERRSGQRIAMINVGPDRMGWILHALRTIDAASARWVQENIALQAFPLAQQLGFRYDVPMPFNVGDIVLHPLYEAKAFAWFLRRRSFDPDRTLFWLTGPPFILSDSRGSRDVH